jgi:thiazole synthase
MLKFYDTEISSRLLLGTARYPSGEAIVEAFRESGAGLATVSLRRAGDDSEEFQARIRSLGVPILPNTAGCYTVREAVTTAHMAREIYGTPWIKLEVLGHRETLQPDCFGTVEAARILAADGFQVFPYCTEDLTVAGRLVDAGCEVLMPWGAPIGTGLGLLNDRGLRLLRRTFPDLPLVLDAGIGVPSHAAAVMELGFDAVLVNTAVATAQHPARMAKAMAAAVEAGRLAWLAGPMQPRPSAVPSTPERGKAVLA